MVFQELTVPVPISRQLVGGIPVHPGCQSHENVLQAYHNAVSAGRAFMISAANHETARTRYNIETKVSGTGRQFKVPNDVRGGTNSNTGNNGYDIRSTKPRYTG